MFNANYGMVNVHYPQTKGYNIRGGFNGYQGHFNAGNRNLST